MNVMFSERAGVWDGTAGPWEPAVQGANEVRSPWPVHTVASSPELQTAVPIEADTGPWTQVIVRKVTPGDLILIKRQIKNAVARGTQAVYRPVKGRVRSWSAPARGWINTQNVHSAGDQDCDANESNEGADYSAGQMFKKNKVGKGGWHGYSLLATSVPCLGAIGQKCLQRFKINIDFHSVFSPQKIHPKHIPRAFPLHV